VPTQQRYKLTLAYRGTRYHGWQKQPALDTYRGAPPEQGQGIPTIQETLARAIESVVRHPVNLVGSSRTDAGVHAKGQLAHFDTDQLQIPADGMLRAVNHALPEDILVREILPVAETFDAISSTTSKRYQYFIWNAPERPIFFADLAWHRWQKLDIGAMQAAAAQLVGTYDFASFARPGHGRDNTIRTILACTVARRAGRIVIAVEGTGFLWQMVRIIVGTLIEIGLGRRAADEIPTILAAKDRQAAGPTAPPQGLFLQWIKTTEAGRAVAPAPAPSLIEDPIPPPLVLRPLRPHYHDASVGVARMLGEWFTPRGLEELEIDLRFASGFVALLGPKVIGFIAFTVAESCATIHWMGLLPEHHRRGIGRRLVERVIEDLTRAGVRELLVSTLGDSVDYEPYARTRAFYRALGFHTHQVIPQPDNPEWHERMILRKNLKPNT